MTIGLKDVECDGVSRACKNAVSSCVGCSNVMQMRKQYKDQFEKKHGLKLGFMSAFVKAAAYALQDLPAVNAVIDESEIVYRDYVDISVAVATPKVRFTRALACIIIIILLNCICLTVVGSRYACVAQC